jgi:hypothetical protein
MVGPRVARARIGARPRARRDGGRSARSTSMEGVVRRLMAHRFRLGSTTSGEGYASFVPALVDTG